MDGCRRGGKGEKKTSSNSEAKWRKTEETTRTRAQTNKRSWEKDSAAKEIIILRIFGEFGRICSCQIKNIESILISGGSNLSEIVKITVYLTDLSLFSQLNEVFEQFFIEDPPARSAVEVKGLPMGSRIEMEAIALKRWY